MYIYRSECYTVPSACVVTHEPFSHGGDLCSSASLLLLQPHNPHLPPQQHYYSHSHSHRCSWNRAAGIINTLPLSVPTCPSLERDPPLSH